MKQKDFENYEGFSQSAEVGSLQCKYIKPSVQCGYSGRKYMEPVCFSFPEPDARIW